MAGNVEPCPYLPIPSEPLSAASMKVVGADRSARFYERALACAQSLWLKGLPAQSVLLINRAFAADLSHEDEILKQWPLPYQAMAWVLANRRSDQFIGNPRRHFQHLATRMVEPRRELRSWRAWGCWFYACRLFPDDEGDPEQLIAEEIIEPEETVIRESLERLGLEGEAAIWAEAIPPVGLS